MALQADTADFAHSLSPEPHRGRTRAILEAHPEIRRYAGTNPSTFLIVVSIVTVQLGVACWIRDQAWWACVLTAYVVGAFANHALGVLIHECAHNLVFGRRIFNTLTGILANLPLGFPTAVSFQRYHLKHHAFQGVYGLDADIPSRWEARLVGTSPLGKACWLLFFPLFQATRSTRLKAIRLVDRWTVLNALVQLGFDAAVYVVLGPQALVYFLLSFVFSIGLHPLGARWIQRHYLVVEGGQETYSYYGVLNVLAFNVGYHNEHHDFPSVPWNNLPRVRRAASAWYDTLAWHGSWTRLLCRFLLDRRLSLFSRMIREGS
jgi:sphingolipid delta-4 desaturase